MLNKLGFAKRFLLLVTPLVTGSAFAVGIATSPTLAASLASSEGSLRLEVVNQYPQEFESSSVANAFASAESGTATASVENNGTSIIDTDEPSVYSSFDSFSTTSGEANNYFGLAQGQFQAIGNFVVEANKNFFLNFEAYLDLETSIDEPQFETASASENTTFVLADTNSQQIYEYFDLYGNLTTQGDDDYLDYQKSENVTISYDSSETSFGGTQEFALAFVQGSLQRFFNEVTHLTLFTTTTNEASVRGCSI